MRVGQCIPPDELKQILVAVKRVVTQTTVAGLPETLKIRIIQHPKLVRYPTGLLAYIGELEITATGFRTKRFELNIRLDRSWRLE